MKKTYKQLAALFSVLSVLLMYPTDSFALIYPINHTLSGLNENPPNASPGTGTISGTFNDVTKVLSFTLNFSGLVGPTTAAHFHAPAGPTTNSPVRIGFAGFPTGVTSGVYANSYVLTLQQEAWLMSDSMYVNVHTAAFPGGEIRHQLYPDAALPVELSSFFSTVAGNTVTLNWSTASELNNSGFQIERKSVISNEWSVAGFVNGNGTVSTSSNYTFSETVNTGRYNYRLRQVDINGNFEYYNLSNEVNVGIPSEFSLSQNYPNPFNPSTKIEYSIPSDGNVSLILYDLSGKEIATIVNENKTAGYYTVNFNANNLSSGIYLYTLKSADFVSTKKMMLVK